MGPDAITKFKVVLNIHCKATFEIGIKWHKKVSFQFFSHQHHIILHNFLLKHHHHHRNNNNNNNYYYYYHHHNNKHDNSY